MVLPALRYSVVFFFKECRKTFNSLILYVKCYSVQNKNLWEAEFSVHLFPQPFTGFFDEPPEISRIWNQTQMDIFPGLRSSG